MPNTTFNLSEEAVRKLLIVAVDVSESETNDLSDAIWEIQGYKAESAAIEFNPDKSTLTDVRGVTFTDVNKFEKSISFDPNTLRPVQDDDGKLNLILHKYERNDQLSKFSQFRVLIGYGYWGDPGSYEADVYMGCTVTPNNLGGESRVGFPYDIDFGGEKILGTIDKLQAGLKFTPAA